MLICILIFFRDIQDREQIFSKSPWKTTNGLQEKSSLWFLNSFGVGRRFKKVTFASDPLPKHIHKMQYGGKTDLHTKKEADFGRIISLKTAWKSARDRRDPLVLFAPGGARLTTLLPGNANYLYCIVFLLTERDLCLWGSSCMNIDVVNVSLMIKRVSSL